MGEFMDVLQITGGVILSAGYIPQIRRILATRSAHDLSLTMWGSVLTGLVLMEIYAVHVFLTAGTLALLLTNTASLTLSVAMVGLILTFGTRPVLSVAPLRMRRTLAAEAKGATVEVPQAA